MKYKPFKELNRRKLIPSVVDLGPAQPQSVDIFLARNFPPTAQNKLCLHILWVNPGSEYTKLLGKLKTVYHIFLIANLDTGKPGIAKLGKFNQQYFHENYLKISLPILWGNLDSYYI